jgi:hypothetical protein
MGWQAQQYASGAVLMQVHVSAWSAPSVQQSHKHPFRTELLK